VYDTELLMPLPFARVHGGEGCPIRMRIALFSECYTPVANGVVTSIQTLRETLRAQGHTVAIFAPGTPQPDDDPDVFRLPELPFPNHPYHFARPFPRLKVDFSALDIQLVHCQHPFTVGHLGADTARKYGLPMVYTAHSLYDMMAANMKSPIMRKMGQKAMRGVVRRFCAKADCVITPSRNTREALRANGIRNRFAVVPSGVLGPFTCPGGRERVRARLGLTPETPLILCVGRLGPEKRVDLLIRAAAVLAHNRKLPAPAADFRVAIVGDGQCNTELEALTAQLGLCDRVLFLGAQPHATIGDWYAAADIFAMSSPSETQGLVLVEAMAAGLPCVTVDFGGPREVVTQGETGLRVAFEPHAFARALDLLLCDPAMCRRLGQNGRRRARAYSPEAMASGVLAVYESVLRLPRFPSPASSRLVGTL
jgi:1,2-diacylglycerol 3-alpha-glucosyltransferase